MAAVAGVFGVGLASFHASNSFLYLNQVRGTTHTHTHTPFNLFSNLTQQIFDESHLAVHLVTGRHGVSEINSL